MVIAAASRLQGVAKRCSGLFGWYVVDERPHPGLRAGEVLQLVSVPADGEEPKVQRGKVPIAADRRLVPRRDVRHAHVEEPVEGAQHREIDRTEGVTLRVTERGKVGHAVPR